MIYRFVIRVYFIRANYLKTSLNVIVQQVPIANLLGNDYEKDTNKNSVL